MLVPNEFKIDLGGDADTPVPVKVTVGDRVFMLGIGLMLVIMVVALKKIKKAP